MKAIWCTDDIRRGHVDATYVCKLLSFYVVKYENTSSVFVRCAFYDDVGNGRSNPWNRQLLLTPSPTSYLSDIYPFSILPASFLVRPCMLIPLPNNAMTAAWSGEPQETTVVSVNDFMRPLNAVKFFDAKCYEVPPYPIVEADGTFCRVPPQIAGKLVESTWGSTLMWGVITRFEKETNKLLVTLLSSTGGLVEGTYSGRFMQRDYQVINQTWDLSDGGGVKYIVPAYSHSHNYNWRVSSL